MTASNLLLTGRPGVGKTTVCQKVVDQYTGPARGFVTDEIREDGTRNGFLLRTLDGEERTLSHVDFDGPEVSKYGVDLEAMEDLACRALQKGLEDDPNTLLVVDEIGKMELLSHSFRSLVPQILDAPHPVLATVPSGGPDLVENIKSRDDVTLLTVTTDNRDHLPGEIREILTS